MKGILERVFYGVYMVVDFLRKLRTEILGDKFELEAELKEIQIQLDENRKFVQNMKMEEEKSFDAFSPRRQNVELRNNIGKLEEEQSKILGKFETIKSELDILNSRLTEFDLVLEDAKNQKVELKKVVDQAENDQFKENWNYDTLAQNVLSIKNKTELCFRLAELDPKRCKYELSSIIKELNGMMKLILEIGDMDHGTDKVDDC
ncbi:MAG: hypothetical protein HFJ04_13570 [Lachnospiraceae bacterium]|nr:hypothetical protein [Lachnospiraceae bacterium]